MAMYKTRNIPDKGAILKSLIKMLAGMDALQEVQLSGFIGPEKYLGSDLGLRSLDLVRLANLIRQEYKQEHIPFQKLFVSDDGQIRQDIRIGDLADFLHEHLFRPNIV